LSIVVFGSRRGPPAILRCDLVHHAQDKPRLVRDGYWILVVCSKLLMSALLINGVPWVGLLDPILEARRHWRPPDRSVGTFGRGNRNGAVGSRDAITRVHRGQRTGNEKVGAIVAAGPARSGCRVRFAGVGPPPWSFRSAGQSRHPQRSRARPRPQPT